MTLRKKVLSHFAMRTSPAKTVFSLTGSHSTGKTTLLGALRQILNGNEFSLLDEPARHLIAQGYAMNNEITDGGMMMYIAHFLSSIRNARAETIICDRSVLDLVAYTTVSRLPQLSSEAHALAEEFLLFEKSVIREYFFVPIEFPMQCDEVRPLAETYRISVEGRIHQLLLENNLPFTRITGPIEARVAKVLSRLTVCAPNA